MKGIVAGAGKFRCFCPKISQTCPKNFFFLFFLCEYFLIKTVFGMSSKKGLHVILGAIFACIFREFAQIFTKSKLLGVRFRPVTSLGNPVGEVFFERSPFFKPCAIVLNYVQHIFPGGRNILH